MHREEARRKRIDFTETIDGFPGTGFVGGDSLRMHGYLGGGDLLRADGDGLRRRGAGQVKRARIGRKVPVARGLLLRDPASGSQGEQGRRSRGVAPRPGGFPGICVPRSGTAPGKRERTVGRRDGPRFPRCGSWVRQGAGDVVLDSGCRRGGFMGQARLRSTGRADQKAGRRTTRGACAHRKKEQGIQRHGKIRAGGVSHGPAVELEQDGTLVVTRATVMSASRGRTVGRVSRPSNANVPRTISTAPATGPKNSGLDRPIFSNRPRPPRRGRGTFGCFRTKTPHRPSGKPGWRRPALAFGPSGFDVGRGDRGPPVEGGRADGFKMFGRGPG